MDLHDCGWFVTWEREVSWQTDFLGHNDLLLKSENA